MSEFGKKIFVLLSLTSILSFLYAPVIEGMVTQWSNDPNYSHGFIIPFMAMYFIWEKRKTLAKIEIEPSYWGIVIMLVGVLFYFIGSIAAELFTMRLSLIVLICGLVVLNLGRTFFKSLLFPLLFLIFMIPPPFIIFNKIAFPLQMLAAKSAEITLNFLDIPVLREGNVIHLASVALEVAEACSGIRSLISLITLGVVFTHFRHKKIWEHVLMTLSTIPIAILANAMRVSGTGVLAHYFGESVAHGFYHSFAGLAVFVVAILLLSLEDVVLFTLPKKIRKSYA